MDRLAIRFVHRLASALSAVVLALAAPGAARAQEPSPHAIDIPPWFANTFLDVKEDVGDAAREGKRLLVYFGQDGCPYCKLLMVNNFAQKAIVDKTRRHFVAVAINMWGDREVTWTDGRTMSEKAFARHLDVQFTPTLLFFDEQGRVVARLNGYYPPNRFEAVLDYVAERRERDGPLSDYLARNVRERASVRLADEPFFAGPPYDLRRKPGGRPLAVVFETTDCPGCDELHQVSFKRKEVLEQVARYDVVRFALAARTEVTLPDGRAAIAQDWARELGVAYAPTIVLFDRAGREALRLEAYMRPFHVAGGFAYVADDAHRSEPSFQRYLQARTEHLRASGQRIDLME
ncbi:MAG: thioredoxin fold domain-containing protein [Betaproteobacteria bacterium]|nr:thioredoxin fold domain-containing protein [Betaproteobacteria bacterium]